MASPNPVPKLYRSVIEDVIERAQNLFAEEGIEEHVLKDLKQLWETKVLQSKATRDVFRDGIRAPVFTFHLPHGLHQTLQASTASLVIPPGRTVPSFNAAELGTSNCSANFAFPSNIGYPLHIPAGVMLQTASGHLYKVNVPVIVTQTPGRTSILQHPIQQIFQPLGQPSVIQTSVPQFSPSRQVTPQNSQSLETVFQQPTSLHSGTVDRKQDPNYQKDLIIPTTEEGINEIIQIDGAGDTSSNEETESTKEVDENEFLGMIVAEELKLLERGGNASNKDSTLNNRENENPERDAVEEEPLNSGDDAQQGPDLFDMDNVIVCQSDKIHQSKNIWKFCLKDGVMCFGGKDYVFAKALGDAEW
ncbi:LOW QUALITY PROTEIN: TFIIA-alpha and beta-like factor [Rhynchocyon petersi]